MKFVRFLVFATTLAATLAAQAPRRPGRGQMIITPSDEMKLDNDQVRVVVDTELPFETEAPRQHPMNRVLIYLDAGHITLTNGDGRVEDITVQANDVRWSRAGEPYIIENQSGHPLRIVEIQLKHGAAGPRPPATKLDPTEVDKEHYQIEFENPSVRVLKVHYGAKEKGVLHEHQLNRVVLYLNDQANFKAGDIRMAGPGTHTEENAGAEPADRIAVEIK